VSPSAISPDARAVVRAAEALTTQVRRIADALSTPVVRYEVATDDDATTTGDDACRPVEIDGQTIIVRGSGDLTPDDARFLGEIVAAAKRKYEAEHGPAAGEESCLTHVKGACDGTTPDCVFPTPGTGRRRRLRVLLNRLNNGIPLTADEAQALTRHVATEICDANDGRKEVQRLGERLRTAREDTATADRIRAEAQRDRDQHAAVLREVLSHFVHKGHPGEPCLQTGWISEKTVAKWRSVVAPTVERPWWKQVAEARDELAEAQAAIERVRAVCADPNHSNMILTRNVLAALDGAEQPTTEPAAKLPRLGTTEGK